MSLIFWFKTSDLSGESTSDRVSAHSPIQIVATGVSVSMLLHMSSRKATQWPPSTIALTFLLSPLMITISIDRIYHHYHYCNCCDCGECFVCRGLSISGKCSFHAKAAVTGMQPLWANKHPLHSPHQHRQQILPPLLPPHHFPTTATLAAITILEVNPADVTISVEKESHASTISTKIFRVPFFYLQNPTESD